MPDTDTETVTPFERFHRFETITLDEWHAMSDGHARLLNRRHWSGVGRGPSRNRPYLSKHSKFREGDSFPKRNHRGGGRP